MKGKRSERRKSVVGNISFSSFREAKRELEERKQTLQRQQEEFRANIHQLHVRN